MKALTIRQPYATLIALGVKHTETRSWNTHYRGPVAIHAGKAMPCRINGLVRVGPYDVERDRVGLLLHGGEPSGFLALPMGCVIAVGTLTSTAPTSPTQPAPGDVDRQLGDHNPGRYAWTITDVRVLRRPIPATGRLGLWAWTEPDNLNQLFMTARAQKEAAL